jgi:hypothetical protein
MAQRRDWNWEPLFETGMQFTNELVREAEKAGKKTARDTAKTAPSKDKVGAKKPSGSS